MKTYIQSTSAAAAVQFFSPVSMGDRLLCIFFFFRCLCSQVTLPPAGREFTAPHRERMAAISLLAHGINYFLPG